MPLKLHFDQEISLFETSTIQCLQSQIPLNRILLAFYFACSNFFHIEIRYHNAFKDEFLVQIGVHLHLINCLCVFLSMLFVLSLTGLHGFKFILGFIVLCQGRMGVVLGCGLHYISSLRGVKDWVITEGLWLWWSFHTDYKWEQINRSLPSPWASL